MSPWTHKFIMHSVTSLRALMQMFYWESSRLRAQQSSTASSTETQKHCTFHCIRDDTRWPVVLWSSSVCWRDFSSCNKFLLRQWGKVKGQVRLAQTGRMSQAFGWLSGVGTYLLCWVGIFCLMLLGTIKLHKTRRSTLEEEHQESDSICRFLNVVNGISKKDPRVWAGWAFPGAGSSPGVGCVLSFTHAKVKVWRVGTASPAGLLWWPQGCAALRRPGEPWLGRQTAPGPALASVFFYCLVTCILFLLCELFANRRFSSLIGSESDDSERRTPSA